MKKYKQLHYLNEVSISCLNKDQSKKYFKSIRYNDYFISYQVKNNTSTIEGQKIVGIFKNTGIIEINKYPDTIPDYCEIKIKLKRVDIYEPFEVKVTNSFNDWNGDISSKKDTKYTSNSIMFRGSVGNILSTNYRYKYILDFMQKHKYF